MDNNFNLNLSSFLLFISCPKLLAEHNSLKTMLDNFPLDCAGVSKYLLKMTNNRFSAKLGHLNSIFKYHFKGGFSWYIRILFQPAWETSNKTEGGKVLQLHRSDEWHRDWSADQIMHGVAGMIQYVSLAPPTQIPPHTRVIIPAGVT